MVEPKNRNVFPLSPMKTNKVGKVNQLRGFARSTEFNKFYPSKPITTKSVKRDEVDSFLKHIQNIEQTINENSYQR